MSPPLSNCRFVPLLCMLGLLSGGCKDGAPAKKDQIELNLWHTFNPQETRSLDEILSRIRGKHPGWRILPTVIPFARAQNKFRHASQKCAAGAPDVFRAELPWVAEFVDKGLILPVPPRAPSEASYLPQALEASRYQKRRWILPASLDCLALLHNRKLLPRAPATLEQFLAAARSQTVDRGGHDPTRPEFAAASVKRWGFYVRADAYWFLPFLWSHGGDMLSGDTRTVLIDAPPAIAALSYYRDLITRHRVAPPRPSPSNDYEDQMRRFGSGQVAMIINGPWATSDLLSRPAFKDPDRLAVAPFPAGPSGKPAAPLSGHGFVVSRCSKNVQAAWELSRELSQLESQVLFARKNNLLPALTAAFSDSRVKQNRIVTGFKAALGRSRARPQHPAIARIFDDFTPAVQAVLLGDATPAEALGGVARAWRRLFAPPSPAK